MRAPAGLIEALAVGCTVTVGRYVRMRSARVRIWMSEHPGYRRTPSRCRVYFGLDHAGREGQYRKSAAKHRRVIAISSAFGQRTGDGQGQHRGKKVSDLQVADQGELPTHRRGKQHGDHGP